MSMKIKKFIVPLIVLSLWIGIVSTTNFNNPEIVIRSANASLPPEKKAQT